MGRDASVLLFVMFGLRKVLFETLHTSGLGNSVLVPASGTWCMNTGKYGLWAVFFLVAL